MLEKPFRIMGRKKQMYASIYYLRNPLDRNRIFYVGRTIQTLAKRLAGHCSSPYDENMWLLIVAIKSAGREPLIEEIERVKGYGYGREKYWIKHHAKHGRLRFQATSFAAPSKKPVKHFYW